jgi:hypothetical protein
VKILPPCLVDRYRCSDVSEDRELDNDIREFADIPKNRYYSVLFRQDGELVVFLDPSRVRQVLNHKISKSEQ